MKQLAMVLAAGALAFTLSACGEEQPRQPLVDEQNTPVTQPAPNEAVPVDNRGVNPVNNEANPVNSDVQKPVNDATQDENVQY